MVDGRGEGCTERYWEFEPRGRPVSGESVDLRRYWVMLGMGCSLGVEKLLVGNPQ